MCKKKVHWKFIGNRYYYVLDCPRWKTTWMANNCYSCTHFNCAGEDFISCLYKEGGEHDVTQKSISKHAL